METFFLDIGSPFALMIFHRCWFCWTGVLVGTAASAAGAGPRIWIKSQTAALIKGKDAATIHADVTAGHYHKLLHPKPAELTTENLRASAAHSSLPECVVWLPSNGNLFSNIQNTGLVTFFQHHFWKHGQVGVIFRVQMQPGFLLYQAQIRNTNSNGKKQN